MHEPIPEPEPIEQALVEDVRDLANRLQVAWFSLAALERLEPGICAAHEEFTMAKGALRDAARSHASVRVKLSIADQAGTPTSPSHDGPDGRAEQASPASL